jgi:hypothetical protein
MRKLAKEIRKNGFDYELVERSDTVAIYKQVDNTLVHPKIISFEVFIIKTREEGLIGDRIIEAGEVFPSNESFGINAWTYSCVSENGINYALKKAYRKYNNLNTQIN